MELQLSMQHLQQDLDNALQTHRNELQRIADHRDALAKCGWHSAGSEGWRSSGSEPRIGIVRGSNASMPSNSSGSQPATPKLQPPPPSGTPIRAPDGKRRAEPSISEEEVTRNPRKSLESESQSTPRSLTSSTRSGSRERTAGGSSSKNSLEGSTSGEVVEITVNCQTTPQRPRTPWADPPQLFVAEVDDSKSFLKDSGHKSSNTSKTLAQTVTRASTTSVVHQPKVRQGSKMRSHTMLSPLSSRRTLPVSGKKSLMTVTRSRTYKLISTVIIALNAIFILWETEERSVMATSSTTRYKQLVDIDRANLAFGVLACVFCFALVADVLLRMLAEGMHFFVSRWNLFEAFVSLTATAEVVVQWYQYSNPHLSVSSLRIFLRKFSMLRILRLLGVIRQTRNIKVLRFIRELRLMVFSLTGSIKSLAWAIVLMLIIFLVFGVFFTDGAIAYCVQHGAMEASHTEDLRRYFGTLSASTLSLYMAMSGGEDWANIMYSLKPLSWEYTLLFILFITFAILALLNVVTAVFVGTAMQQSQADRELVVQQEMQQKGEFVTLMQQVFEEMDTNSSGALSLEEFEKHIEDEKILAYLRTQQIDISQVRTLFALLDVDGTGEVDLEEFVGGCVRLRGGATTMDLAVLKYQVEWILHNVQSLHRLAEAQTPKPDKLRDAASTKREELQ